jgi:hypothetical protein
MEQRRQHPLFGGVLGHTIPEDGALAWGHIQGVHPQRASMLLQRDVIKHEEEI